MESTTVLPDTTRKYIPTKDLGSNDRNSESSRLSTTHRSCRIEYTGRYSIDQNRLQLTVIRAGNLPTPRGKQSTVFVRLCIINKLSGDLPKMDVYKTREIPYSPNPTFADTFTIAQDWTWKELVNSTIHFQVVYCRKGTIFQAKTKEVVADGHVEMHSMKSSLRHGKIAWSDLNVFRFPCRKRKSTIQSIENRTKAGIKVSIGHMQDTNVLSVFLHKLTKIPYSHNSKEVYVTARLFLPDKTTQKRKTTETKLSLSDIPLCSQFSFDLPDTPLEGTSLLLKVKAKQGLIRKKSVIGGVLIGGYSTASQAEREHWQEVVDSKEAMICRQHQLHF